MDEERRTRIEELAARNHYTAQLSGRADRLTDLLGIAVGTINAVTFDEVQVALAAVKEQERGHLVWHRAWGSRLRPEVLETTHRLADLLKDKQAILIWGNRPPLGFDIPVATALRVLPEHIGPEADRVSDQSFGDDLLLVGENGRSGLRLQYGHYPFADQYDLRSWGDYARSVAG